MQQKKIPLRMCTGCGLMKPKKELVRVVKTPSTKDEEGNIIAVGSVELDLTGKKAGRGAYVCKNVECLLLARKARRFERAFSQKIEDSVYDSMEAQLKNE